MKEVIVHCNDQATYEGNKANRNKLMWQYKYAGFTAIITPIENQEFAVQVSYCSKKDQFCKKRGIEEARKHIPIAVVKLRQLPKILQNLEDGLYKRAYYISFLKNRITPKYYRVALSLT